jgi:cystathionine gamma-lyase
MGTEKNLDFNTRAIHVGQAPDPTTGAIVPPIYATSTYVQESPGKHKGFEYSRTHNPTRNNLEAAVASLEEGVEGLAFASGLAATATILDALPAGSHIIATDDLYGGTLRLFNRVRGFSSNLEVTYVDMNDFAKLENTVKNNSKLLWVETPTNPMLKIVNLAKAAEFAKKHKLISVCDNTFASPYIQQPLTSGFDLSLHSSTKYLNGHSDVVGGIVVAREKGELLEKLRFLQNAVGSIPSPFDCYLTHRGLKTLGLRMKQHGENALEIAQYLAGNKKFKRVIYPGLSSHPHYELAKLQMRNFGGMISIELAGGLAAARSFCERLKIFALAESLGAVESLVNHPAIMTHASVPKEKRDLIGISDGLVRLSVGVEDAKDLLADIEQALD